MPPGSLPSIRSTPAAPPPCSPRVPSRADDGLRIGVARRSGRSVGRRGSGCPARSSSGPPGPSSGDGRRARAAPRPLPSRTR
eukprot:4713213-Pyramimonas_sp.AAC.1